VKLPCTLGSNLCGVIYHKVGGAPSDIFAPTSTDSYNDVFGMPNPGGGIDIFVVGLNGAFVVSNSANPSSWSKLAPGNSAALNGVHGADGDVYAVGANGTILHYVP
jgi:hypothetical protein